jgi:tetratricopeptide (TPR) repeat protein
VRASHRRLFCRAAASLVAMLTLVDVALAQFVVVSTAQADFAKLSTNVQESTLADIVRRSGSVGGGKCLRAQVSAERTYNDGGGGWLVLCEDGLDYWVLLPAKAGKAATVLPCLLARVTANTDCYANLRTILPDSVEQCLHSTVFDRSIRACSTIIQSGRLDDRPDGLSVAYEYRGIAFTNYRQFDLALLDFDKAVQLNPNNVEILYNRAVALERKGALDDAIVDLDKVLRLQPGFKGAAYERAYCLLKKGEYQRAIADFDRAIEMSPDLAMAYLGRATAYKALGDTAKFNVDAQKARELGAQGPAAAAMMELGEAARKTPAAGATSSEVPSDVPLSDRTAAYCMQTSFQYAGRFKSLAAVQRDTRSKAQALLDRSDLTNVNKQQIGQKMASLDAEAVESDAKAKHWNDNLGIFLAHLQKTGALGKGWIAAVSSDAMKDERTMIEMYRSCVRGCGGQEEACRRGCQEKSDVSDSSKRMLECDEKVREFR